MIAHKRNKNQTSVKRVNNKKLAIYFVILLIFVIGLTVAGLYMYKTSENSTESDESFIYKEGSGGDYTLVIKHHKQAVAAWKAGDKGKAKELAEKGLAVNDELTIEQQSKIPQQIEVMHDLSDIKHGNYIDYEDQ